MTDRLRFTGDLSYSRNQRDESITETYAGFGCCVTSANQNANRVFDTIDWDISGALAGGYPTYSSGLNYADASQVSLGDRAPRSEEHTSELQSLMRISYAVFCLKKKKIT